MVTLLVCKEQFANAYYGINFSLKGFFFPVRLLLSYITRIFNPFEIRVLKLNFSERILRYCKFLHEISVRRTINMNDKWGVSFYNCVLTVITNSCRTLKKTRKRITCLYSNRCYMYSHGKFSINLLCKVFLLFVFVFICFSCFFFFFSYSSLNILLLRKWFSNFFSFFNWIYFKGVKHLYVYSPWSWSAVKFLLFLTNFWKKNPFNINKHIVCPYYSCIVKKYYIIIKKKKKRCYVDTIVKVP